MTVSFIHVVRISKESVPLEGLCVCVCADLKIAKSEEGEEGDGGQMIPLLLQNKPPVREDSETGELADLSMRPDPVR